MRKAQFGELSAFVTGGSDGSGAGDGPVLVLLHGFGAPGEDLVDLSRFVPAPAGLRWVFLEAPLRVEGGPGRAWWMIDPALFERRMRGDVVDRSDELPSRLPLARAQLSDALDAIERELGVPREQQLLGGFSQGSMLSLDQALHAERPPRGLILLSSTLIARSEWGPRMQRCRDLPILQTHGRQDMILPYPDAERLRALLEQAGAALTFVPFTGGHELPRVALEALAGFLAEQLKA